MRFVLVSDVHITQQDGIRKIKNISERQLVIAENLVNIQRNVSADFLIVQGDWFDNTKKLSLWDLKLTNIIFSTFKKIFFIDGNHDVYQDEVSTGNILKRMKNLIYFDKVTVLKVNSRVYFWFLPFLTKSDSVIDEIEKQLKTLLQSNTYVNDSTHLFFSHLPIYEIESVEYNSQSGLKFFDLKNLLLRYKIINFHFFQGHYHLKTTETRIGDSGFHIISQYPKNFSDKITKVKQISEFGYYLIDVFDNGQVNIEFYPYDKLFLFYEVINDDEFTKLLNFIKENDTKQKYMFYVKILFDEMNKLEILKQFNSVRKVQVITDTKKLSLKSESINVQDLQTGISSVNVFDFLIQYVEQLLKDKNDISQRTLEIINEIIKQIQTTEGV